MDENTQSLMIPTLRFKGFTNSWWIDDLNNYIYEKEGGRTKEELYPILTSSKKGIFLRDEFFTENTSVKSSDGYKIIPFDFITYRVISDDKKFRFNIQNIVKNGLISTSYPVFNFKEINKRFVLIEMNNNPYFQKQILLNICGGTRSELGFEKLKTFQFKNTFIQEQNKLGDFFNNVDSLINSTTLKIKNLKMIKIALLQKLFPQNDHSTPEIRFSGFTDAWEQCKFNEIATLSRGLTYSPKNIINNGVRVLRSSNINEEYFIKCEDDIFVEKSCVNIDYAKDGDILITSANGSSRLVGKHSILSNILNEKVVHGGFMLLARTKNPYFLNASMSSSWYKKFIDLYVSGGNGAIGNLSKSDLDNYSFLIPKDEEQQKIGQLFNDLDSLITLHQCKLEKLKGVKSSLLSKMFC